MAEQGKLDGLISLLGFDEVDVLLDGIGIAHLGIGEVDVDSGLS